jgi:hypothetical protein
MQAEQPDLYDGSVAALLAYRAAPDALDLTVAPSRYRFTAVTHERPLDFVRAYGSDGLGSGLACAVSVLLPSGGILMGRRSHAVHRGRGKWHPISGHFDPTSHRGPGGDPCVFATATAELWEEVRLAAHQVGDLRATGLQIHEETLKPELHFVASTSLALGRIRELHAGARDAFEIDALIELTPDVIPAFLAGHLGPITRIARAAVELAFCSAAAPPAAGDPER